MRSKVHRPLEWVGQSKDDISALPKIVKASFGYRLRKLQEGVVPDDAKALSQFGSGVFELREQFDGNAFRLMYLAKLSTAIYVLHVFMKKSKSGIGLPKPDAQVIRVRLRRALELDMES
jgi:phage-related protein